MEAIKARQSGNETAVSVILEANRQRRIVRRQQQQHQQQKQLLKFHGTESFSYFLDFPLSLTFHPQMYRIQPVIDFTYAYVELLNFPFVLNRLNPVLDVFKRVKKPYLKTKSRLNKSLLSFLISFPRFESKKRCII